MPAKIRKPRVLTALLGLALVAQWFAAVPAAAFAPADPAFQRTWARTDKPVSDGNVARTWIWGPEAFTDAVPEPYAESPNGVRMVQYYDKSRMEINNPNGDPNSLFYVTNGLLVVEMITGKVQLGDNTFQQRAPADVNVAGDSDDPSGPTYATFAGLLDVTAGQQVNPLKTGVHRDGSVYDSDTFAAYGIGDATYVDVTKHWIAQPFWDFMNSSGLVYEDGSLTNAALFQNPYYATGYPITDPYWANVKVAGTYKDVLMQCFERRCLTYTPGNSAGFETEAGNVGQHYHTWRYQQNPSGAPYVPVKDISSFDDPRSTPLQTPIGVAIDSGGHLYVADYNLNQIVAYDAYGIFLERWGSEGSGQGQFSHPSGVAVDSDYNVYVADTFNNRVQKFDPGGNFLATWGSLGSGAGQLNNPYGIAFGNDHVYVADTGNNRIEVFDRDGNYLSTFGTSGNGAGQLSGEWAVAVGPDHNIYVADTGNNRVEVFDMNGGYLGAWGAAGSGQKEFNAPRGISVDSSDNVYVADTGNARVQVFDADGNYLNEWGGAGSSDGDLPQPYGIVASAYGVHVTDGMLHQVDLFGLDGTYYRNWSSGVGGLGTVRGLAIGPDGSLYVCSPYLNRIEKLSPNGGFLTAWGSWGTGPDQFKGCRDVAVDDTGNVYVVDEDNNRVLKYDGNGNYLTEWNGDGVTPFDAPSAIAFWNGHVYVEAGQNRIQIFTTAGAYVSQIVDAHIVDVEGIAVASDGSLYASDYSGNVILKFDASGAFVSQWGSAGSGNGQFNGPRGLAIDSHGSVYVCDESNHRIQQFDADGNYLGQWGSLGDNLGQFYYPYGIAIDPNDTLWVADGANARLQEFVPGSP